MYIYYDINANSYCFWSYLMINKSKNELLMKAEELSRLSKVTSILDNTKKIVSNHDSEATRTLITDLKNIGASTKENKTKNLVSEVYNLILYFYGFEKIIEVYSDPIRTVDDRSLEDLLAELNSLIGLDEVKVEIDNLIAFQRVKQLRKKMNLKVNFNTLHIAFLGNPGTGKTTVARIIGHIYKKIGLLSKGHLIEVSRSDLIAEYQGQTAIKVNKVINEAKGGVLFIDEAYSITENEHTDSYGRECITELTKALEDDRDDLVVIVAGYNKEMNNFFMSNPGLKSRFNKFIYFEDYTKEELIKIFNKICIDNDYLYTNEALEKVKLYIEDLIVHQKAFFGNGRDIRNMFDDIVIMQAKRISEIKTEVSKETLITFIADDIPKFKKTDRPHE